MWWNVEGRRQEGGKHIVNYSGGIRKERGAGWGLQPYSVLTGIRAVNEPWMNLWRTELIIVTAKYTMKDRKYQTK